MVVRNGALFYYFLWSIPNFFFKTLVGTEYSTGFLTAIASPFSSDSSVVAEALRCQQDEEPIQVNILYLFGIEDSVSGT